MGMDKEKKWMIRWHFMQTVTVEHKRIARSHAADHRTHVNHGKTTISDKREEIILPQVIRLKRPVEGILHVMTNWTASQLTICQKM